MRQKLEHLRGTVQHAGRLLADPRKKLEQFSQRVDELLGRLGLGLRHHVRRDRALLTSLTGALDHLNPLGILSRGYSVTRSLPGGAIIKDASVVKPGDTLRTTLHQGEIISRVEESRRP
jgi:exodeoxyribonuclease VII large subunit